MNMEKVLAAGRIPYNPVYLTVYGSHAYGTNTEDSDLDIRGIFIPSIDKYISNKEIKDFRNEEDLVDIVLYPIHKFFDLAMKGNPSVLEWLYVPETCHLEIDAIGRALIRARSLFVSKSLYHRYKGFAYSEFSSLQRMSGETGEKRKNQIREIGYSPKNAMNCIRLLQEGIELLICGHLILPRPNPNTLKTIKAGELGYNTLTAMFNKLMEEIDDAYEKSSLPEKVDVDKLDRFMIDLVKIYDKRNHKEFTESEFEEFIDWAERRANE